MRTFILDSKLSWRTRLNSWTSCWLKASSESHPNDLVNSVVPVKRDIKSVISLVWGKAQRVEGSHYQLENLSIADYRKLFAKPAQRFWLVHHFRLVFDKQLSGNNLCSTAIGKESSYNMLHPDSSGRQNLLSSWSHSFVKYTSQKYAYHIF